MSRQCPTSPFSGRLCLVLRNSSDFQNMAVINLIFNASVRCKLEAGTCVCMCIHMRARVHALLLNRVRKAFLRYLYQQAHVWVLSMHNYSQLRFFWDAWASRLAGDLMTNWCNMQGPKRKSRCL